MAGRDLVAAARPALGQCKVSRPWYPAAVVIGLILSLAACKLGPDYERPEVAPPEDFSQQLDSGENLANLPWWELFDDERLVELVGVALDGNKDVAVAAARVEEARARLGFVNADLIPSVEAQASSSRGSGILQIPSAEVLENHNLTASVFYEIDLFGRLRRSTEAARAELLSTQYALQTVLTALIADVANGYFLLRDLDARYAITERTLAARQDSTRIIRERFRQGTVTMLNVNQAEIEEADSAANLAELERQIVIAENVLSILLGRNPGPIVRGRNITEQLITPTVPGGLPAELLERRPDVRTAEQILAAQTANIGVAEALRWPTLTLTGAFGYASDDLSGLISSDNEQWSVSAGLLAPIFNAGRNKRRVEIQRALTEQALAQYELTVLFAFRDVEDALATIRTLRDEAAARQMQLIAARSASTLSRARYDGGVSSYLEVLDSDRSLFQAEINASAVGRAQLSAVVALYKALGGGWDSSTTAP